MTPTQFHILMTRIDKIEDRMRRGEIRLATLFAGIAILAFLDANGHLKIGS